MTELHDEVEEFYERDEFQTFEPPHPTKINEGYCEEFADFVLNNGYSNLEKRTTFDIVDEPDKYPETEAGNIEPWHVWLTDGNLHYDAECPHGVSKWSQLPIFRANHPSKYREE